MMREFLATYKQAKNLDTKQYNHYFPDEIKEFHKERKKGKRADFLLFGDQIVCEFKEIQNIKVRHQVEKLLHKNLSEQDFKRSFYNSISKSLSKANRQIGNTKKALNHLDAFGLIILENLIEKDLSVLSLIDAAERKMNGGLVNVDCILCLDFINTFSDSEGKPVRYIQTVSRDTEKSRQLGKLLDQLMKDFCDQSGIPLLEGFDLEKAEQTWLTNKHGKYSTYEARIDFLLPAPEIKLSWRQRLTLFMDKWWWLIPLPAILYDWLIR